MVINELWKRVAGGTLADGVLSQLTGWTGWLACRSIGRTCNILLPRQDAASGADSSRDNFLAMVTDYVF